MLIIRHYKLVPPYDNYELLTGSLLDGLAINAVSPDIQTLPKNLPFDDETEDYIRSAELMICSEAARTFQTCLGVQKRLGMQGHIVQTPLFNEINFLPTGLVDQVHTNPLSAARSNIFPAILQGAAETENKHILKTRMDDILDYFFGKNIVAFSHGFLIRLLKSYIRNGYDIDRALQQAEFVPPVGYLEPFMINKQQRFQTDPLLSISPSP